jgi:hypothetical protein
MEDEYITETTSLDVLREIFEADQTFFSSIRFIEGSQRSALIAGHLRNVSSALAILRQPQSMTTRMVVNIPLDLSGNNAFFDPVPVAPTRQQIEAATDRHVAVTDTMCSICQEPVACATRIRSCGHCFHGQCLQQWLSINPRCPMCRQDIRENNLRDTSGNTINEGHSVHTD